MIKFSAQRTDNQGIVTLLGFGLSAENVKRLQKGEPISFPMVVHGKRARVLIFYGETEQAMAKDLQEFIGPETHVYGDDGDDHV